MRVIFDDRWSGDNGIGRYSKELAARISHEGVSSMLQSMPTSPLDPFRLSYKLRNEVEGVYYSPGYNAPLMSRVPYIFTLHDLNHIDRNENSNVLKRLYYQSVLRVLCRRAEAIVTVSDFSRSRIIDWFGIAPEHVFNVGNGVSEIFHNNSEKYRPGYRYALCVGNRKEHKNEKGALRAFLSSDLQSDYRLIFTGPVDGELKAIAQAHGAGHRVIFAGQLTEEKLASLYKGAEFLLFPSFYEGFGLPIIEAFASGTPVITSNVTAMPEVSGGAAILVNPGDIKSISAGINKLIDSPELVSEMRNMGLERALYYRWSAVSGRLSELLAQVYT